MAGGLSDFCDSLLWDWIFRSGRSHGARPGGDCEDPVRRARGGAPLAPRRSQAPSQHPARRGHGAAGVRALRRRHPALRRPVRVRRQVSCVRRGSVDREMGFIGVVLFWWRGFRTGVGGRCYLLNMYQMSC